MSRPKRRPKYCGPHKPSGLGYVWHKGKPHYFSGCAYGSPESLGAYDRFCRENYDDEGRVREEVPMAGANVAYLVERFLDFSSNYYGDHSAEHGHYERLCRTLFTMYGTILVDEFGPLRLQAVRQRLVEEGKLRTSINRTVNRIRYIFKWGVSQQIVRPDTLTALQTVTGLRRGKTEAKEPSKVRPVDWSDVEPVLKVLSPTLEAMVRLQALTGMRSANLCEMRPSDIDRSDAIWTYVPASHKNEWREQGLMIPIGPRGQQAISQLLAGREAKAFIFQPLESERWRAEARGVPVRRNLADKYDPRTYRKAVLTGQAEVAGIPRPRGTVITKDLLRKHGAHPWTPHQLRHSIGTQVRSQFGIEAARVYLGHATTDATLIYAEHDAKLAFDVARKIG